MKALEDDVNALDEARAVALARSAAYQQNLRNYHGRRLRLRSFEVGDLVLRLKQESHIKLESPWEGPYIVTEAIPGGAYRLNDKKSGKDQGNPHRAAAVILRLIVSFKLLLSIRPAARLFSQNIEFVINIGHWPGS